MTENVCAGDNFSNDESTCRPTLLKTVSTTGILINQVLKLNNSYFKEHLWKAAPVLQKNILFKSMLRNMLMIAPF